MTDDATKQIDTSDVRRASVRVQEPRTQPLVIQLAITADEAPRWWTWQRDDYLRKFWPTEPFLAGAIYSVASRNAAFRYKLTGPARQVKRCQEMLSQADLGNGWVPFILKVSVDLLTTDNGAFIEVIRPARARTEKGWVHALRVRDDRGEPVWMSEDGKSLEGYAVKDLPTEAPIGLAHLDSLRCQRTGDPDYPVIYTDLTGKQHKLNWWQVITLEDLPSPQEDMNGVGWCATSRALRLAQILRDVQIYRTEKVSGRFARAVHLTNVDPEAIQDAITQAQEHANDLGLSRYMQPILAATLDPNNSPALQTIELASMPDGFDEESAMRWYIAGLAMGLGVDYGFLAPLPGSGLGTATQVETQARSARGKSSMLFMKMLEHKFNFGGVLPSSVSFEFQEVDTAEKKTADEGAKLRAETRAARIASGEITAQVARQIAVDEGDLDEQYLAMMGEEDETPVTSVDDTESLEAQQLQEETIDREAPEPETPEPQVPPLPEAVESKQGPGEKVKPKGKPLRPWGKKPVEITPQDVAQAICDWDAAVPEARGLLTARTPKPGER